MLLCNDMPYQGFAQTGKGNRSSMWSLAIPHQTQNTITYALFHLLHAHARTRVCTHLHMHLGICIQDLITAIQNHRE